MSSSNVELLDKIKEQYQKTPFYGSRRMAVVLNNDGYKVNRKKIQRFMKLLGLEAIYQKPNLSRLIKAHKKYPYLLRDMDINKVNQVWATDITYVKCNQGKLYLTAVMDWHSRYILSWKLSNTMDTDFCLDSLNEALEINKPLIFNTDQGSQYTSDDFTSRLIEQNIQISMDGKGCYIDNILIERFWRSIKYEDLFIKDYVNVQELRNGIRAYINFYNFERPHESLGYKTPAEIYYDQNKLQLNKNELAYI